MTDGVWKARPMQGLTFLAPSQLPPPPSHYHPRSYCEASSSVYWCFDMALFRFDSWFSFSHPFSLPPVADSVPVSDRVLVLMPFSLDAVVLLHSMSHSEFLTVDRPWPQPPTHPYMRTGGQIPTLTATIGV